jgi:hypothetical protein
MWDISNQPFGFVVTFSGRPSVAELTEWLEESKRRLSQPLPEGWGVIIDMREMMALDPAGQKLMSEGRNEYQQRGMKRVATVLSDPITILQFRRLGRAASMNEVTRFIDSVSTPNWKSAAKQWVIAGIEPPQ